MKTATDSASGAAALFSSSCADLFDGAHSWRLWSKFAWHDLIARYRRSWFGPLWIALSAAVFIGALSFLYSTLFHTDLRQYLPYVAIGFVLWGFISAIANEGVLTFVEAEPYIRQVRVNLFVYVLRVISRNVIVLAHQFVVVVAVLLICGRFDLRTLPLALVGMLLFLSQAIWVVPLLAVIGTRFRDLQPIIANALQVLFFITPVIWSSELLGSRRWVADFNPLSSLIAVVREPLLGSVPSLSSYLVVLVITTAGLSFAMLVYGRFRTRIVYWL